MVTVFNTSKEIAQARPAIAILPVGSLEQHGEHLPIATDWLRADDAARRLAERLGDCYLLPALAYALQEHMDLAGTITLRPSTLALVVEDIVLSLRHQGIRRIVVLTTHGGNWILKPTIRDLNFRYPDIRIIHADGPLTSEPERMPCDIHAGAGETGAMLALRPELVKGRSPDFAPNWTGVERLRGLWDEHADRYVGPFRGRSGGDGATLRGRRRAPGGLRHRDIARLDELLGPLPDAGSHAHERAVEGDPVG